MLPCRSDWILVNFDPEICFSSFKYKFHCVKPVPACRVFTSAFSGSAKHGSGGLSPPTVKRTGQEPDELFEMFKF